MLVLEIPEKQKLGPEFGDSGTPTQSEWSRRHMLLLHANPDKLSSASSHGMWIIDFDESGLPPLDPLNFSDWMHDEMNPDDEPRCPE